eukprot:CAMPEP_0177588846 /NCGR_PEP_ID=MMETSP0419_2-20121207/6459_1 /TAXON_ID=582737 /ORGANISM="Tetraselmis sp., Strain GSL018" /LENGTH=162 /DNA_ID=CAMNT_0019079103 /DNA_START=38 /DNA_END=522 /DNA_ORIENTATION=-
MRERVGSKTGSVPRKGLSRVNTSAIIRNPVTFVVLLSVFPVIHFIPTVETERDQELLETDLKQKHIFVTGTHWKSRTIPDNCRFIFPEESVREVTQRECFRPSEVQSPHLKAGSLQPPNRTEGSCERAWENCRRDSTCHVNQWESILKEHCQRQKVKGCSPG